jgi:hypothetical protein
VFYFLYWYSERVNKFRLSKVDSGVLNYFLVVFIDCAVISPLPYWGYTIALHVFLPQPSLI